MIIGIVSMHKKCSLCHMDKPIGEYSKDAQRKDGLSRLCKTCR